MTGGVSPALARGGVSVRVGDAFGEFGRVGPRRRRRDDAATPYSPHARRRNAAAPALRRLDRPTATAASAWDVASPFGGARSSSPRVPGPRARRRRAFRRHARAFRGDARLRRSPSWRRRRGARDAPRGSRLARRNPRGRGAADDVAFAAFVFAFAAPPVAAVRRERLCPQTRVVSTFGRLVTVRGAFGVRTRTGAGSPQCRFRERGARRRARRRATGAECFSAGARAEHGARCRRGARRHDFFFTRRTEASCCPRVRRRSRGRLPRRARGARRRAGLRVPRAAVLAAAPRRRLAARGTRACVSGTNARAPVRRLRRRRRPGGVLRLLAAGARGDPRSPSSTRSSRPRRRVRRSRRARELSRRAPRGALRGFDRERDEPSDSCRVVLLAFAYHDARRASSRPSRARLAAEDGGGTGLVVFPGLRASAGDPGGRDPSVGVSRRDDRPARRCATSSRCRRALRRDDVRLAGFRARRARVVAGRDRWPRTEPSRDVSSWTTCAEGRWFPPRPAALAVVPSAAVRARERPASWARGSTPPPRRAPSSASRRARRPARRCSFAFASRASRARRRRPSTASHAADAVFVAVRVGRSSGSGGRPRTEV